MSANNLLKVYEGWDISKLTLPSRSRLFPLEPIGIGTPCVESLTSYIARLAEAHCLQTGVLMEKGIAPLIGKKHGGANLHKIYNFTKALNGTGVMASDLVEALAHLTCRDDLQFLTMLTWSNVFSPRNSLRPVRAWCPFCYEQWHLQHQTVYEPLIWSLKVIKICSDHNVNLSQICPHCHKQNFSLAWQSQPGYCSKCHQWLGSRRKSNPEHNKILTTQPLEWETWVFESVGELLSVTQSLEYKLTRKIIAQSLSKCVDTLSRGNIASFARLLHTPKNTLWLWCKGKNIPTLDSLLKICYHLNISVFNFLTGQLVGYDHNTMLPENICQKSERATAQEFKANEVQAYLEAILAKSELPPSSIEEVARQLNVDRRTIFRHFPHLCRAVSARYLHYKKEAVSAEIQQCCQQVQEITLRLYQQGIYPSELRVSEYLSKPGHLRHRKVRDAFKRARRMLKLEP